MLLIPLLIVFIISILMILLSYVPWVQTNLRWMTSIGLYIGIGLLLGGGLAFAGYIIGHHLAKLITN